MANGNSSQGPEPGKMPSAAQLEAELGRAIDQPNAVLNRIASAVASIRQASDAAGLHGVDTVKKLRSLADEIEGEVHNRLTEIIDEGRAFWDNLERQFGFHK